VSDGSQLPHKVAILPFANHTSNPVAATVVRKMFYNFFSSLNYLDLEPLSSGSAAWESLSKAH
jgi:hypothetical protein